MKTLVPKPNPNMKKEVPKQMKRLKNVLQEQMLNSKDILFFTVTGIMLTRIRNLVSLFRNMFPDCSVNTVATSALLIRIWVLWAEPFVLGVQ